MAETFYTLTHQKLGMGNRAVFICNFVLNFPAIYDISIRFYNNFRKKSIFLPKKLHKIAEWKKSI